MTEEERRKRSEYFTPDDEISFNLIDKATVDRLRREGDIKLPPKKVSIPKDRAWNTKLMSSKLLQGIENGDSIPKISKSLMEVIGRNEVSAVRNARTMVTGAENVGRQDSYQDLKSQGVIQKKVWIATPDDRTRESHLAIDDEEVDIDAMFSNGCKFPGDPDCSDTSEVWNCRCTMRTHIIGFRRADGSVSQVFYDRDKTMHEAQIEAEKERRVKEDSTPKAVNEFLEQEKERLGTLKAGKLAAELWDTGIYDKNELLTAMKGGQLDKYKDDYLAILDDNGDVTIKGAKTTTNGAGTETTPLQNMNAEVRGVALEAGMSNAEIDKMFSNVDTFFSNQWDKADPKEVDAFIDLTATYDGVISRGMHFNTTEELDAFMNGVEKGSVIGMNGKNSSWSSDNSVARRYAHMGDDEINSVMIICDKNVSSSAACKFARYTDEQEVIAKSDTRWTVTKVDTVTLDNGMKKVTMHVIERTNP